MLSAFANCLKIPDLKRRIIFTLLLIVIVRMGAAIPCPGVNPVVLGEFFSRVVNHQEGGSVVGLFNLFSGGALENCAIFSLGIMPYISASIMMQLMTAVFPTLGKLVREEGGRQKISQYTRYMTVGICLIQGYLLAVGFEKPSSNPLLPGIDRVIQEIGTPLVQNPGMLFRVMTVIHLSAGTMLLMWLGEQITEKGIGNGISIVITVGIIARLPAALVQAWQTLVPAASGGMNKAAPLMMLMMVVFLLGVIAATIAITQALRKIMIQYAKQVRGNRVYGGQSSFLPLKVNYAGVMPIIFAQSVLMLISMMFGFFESTAHWAQSFSHGTAYYTVLAGMIFFFSYFWVATQFNPVQIADDLKKNGGFIPGIRPGQATAEHLEYIMVRLTLAGAVFLTALAVLPTLIQVGCKIPATTAQFFGGTSLLIMVGVMLDTMRQMETFLLQRHYDGFLKKGKIRGRSAYQTPAAGAGASSETVVWLSVLVGGLIVIGVTMSMLMKH